VRYRNTNGYTLIELVVVMVLIGIMVSLTIPRFRDAMLTDELKKTTREMVGLIRNLRNEAVRNQKAYVLHFDLESGLYWIDSTDMSEEERVFAREKASSLPGGVRVQDVWHKGKGKKMTGESTILFNKKGYVQQSAIHLISEDDREFTLVLSPFIGEVKVIDRYVEFQDT